MKNIQVVWIIFNYVSNIEALTKVFNIFNLFIFNIIFVAHNKLKFVNYALYFIFNKMLKWIYFQCIIDAPSSHQTHVTENKLIQL